MFLAAAPRTPLVRALSAPTTAYACGYACYRPDPGAAPEPAI